MCASQVWKEYTHESSCPVCLVPGIAAPAVLNDAGATAWRAVGELQRVLLPQVGEVLLSVHPKAARTRGPGQRVASRCVLEHYTAHAHATAVRGGRERGPETRDLTLN
jgi:hypothetical protein